MHVGARPLQKVDRIPANGIALLTLHSTTGRRHVHGHDISRYLILFNDESRLFPSPLARLFTSRISATLFSFSSCCAVLSRPFKARNRRDSLSWHTLAYRYRRDCVMFNARSQDRPFNFQVQLTGLSANYLSSSIFLTRYIYFSPSECKLQYRGKNEDYKDYQSFIYK